VAAGCDAGVWGVRWRVRLGWGQVWRVGTYTIWQIDHLSQVTVYSNSGKPIAKTPFARFMSVLEKTSSSYPFFEACRVLLLWGTRARPRTMVFDQELIPCGLIQDLVAFWCGELIAWHAATTSICASASGLSSGVDGA